MSADFYLVQRLDRRDAGMTGFDARFGCQYMGSSEFEWGAIPDSLKRIRSARKVVIHEGEVTRKGITRTVYVVGDKKVVTGIPERLTAWMVDEHPRGKEWSYFPEYVDGTQSEYQNADAWWGLGEDAMWTLDATIADDLLAAIGAS